MDYIGAAALTETLASNGVTLRNLADDAASTKAFCSEMLDKFFAAKTYDEEAKTRNTLIAALDRFRDAKHNYGMAKLAERLMLIGKAKENHPDAIFLLRAADAYYIYDDDAAEAARVLGEESQQEIYSTPVVTFPLEAIDPNLCKFVRAGKRIVIMGEDD